MDYATFRGISTVGMLILFIGIYAWAYSSRRKKSFDEAANLVFADEQNHDNKIAGEESK
ncbi:cbb3-type cytochrome c oxidase subunit 3 [Psychrobium sp. 1_MG-2023]|uniref:cbb3-type cytochrome oxidase subunit 3 n=1 Tax=Psychrobium sp. 1_MG-2023 TaxID=3062624 RepID=UPI000C334D1E|nr:cbb3-type cytochrome c oxidase subunit 3 [Psychrobium sp. 1_MG-2023]MDP2561549.1 cbb3-type cytochrome c oxidase subunit 3 [Psychrobium sp. 1_MG-2023]PKF55012.1 CcoQ/FixQ family Cbb3-type cytochrome c oxidase assembly chaperone [Alteromonadales bacterium alter-6D02]